MPGAGAVTDAKACPVCGGGLCPSGEPYRLEEILDLWRPVSFSDTAVAEHKAQADATRLFVCDGCGLEIFLPQIIGTPRFYVEAYNLAGTQNDSEFTYSETKWDFDEALKDASGCRTLLEVGCGPGHFLKKVSREVPEIYGVEYNEPAAVLARAQGLKVYSDPAQVPLAGQLDAVLSFHVLEHVGDPVAFLAQLVSLVRPGGRIGISVPNQDGPMQYVDPCAMNMPPHHATRWQVRSLTALAKRIGTRLQRVAYEPLLLENHSYYSVSWVRHILPGRGPVSVLGRALLSIVLRGFFRLLRAIGMRYFPWLRGQSIYVLLSRPAGDASR